MAPNIKSVVSREQMELFPDYTTADAIRRLPGVYIGQDHGEGRYVLIRGTEPRLTNIKINGEELATSRQEERYSQLDIIGSNQMASIEVVKALTPDMDGDAIGGTVNLVTRSAFDYPGMRLRATVGGGYGELRGNPLYQGKFSYSDRFGADKNMGLTLTANYDRTDKGTHNSETDWGSEDDVNDNEIPWALQQKDLRDYYQVRDRYGVGTSFEYRLDANNRFYLGGMWNLFRDDQERGRFRYRFDKGDYLNPEGTSIQGAAVIVESTTRIEDAIQQQLSAGGSHIFDAGELDYKVAYSYAKQESDPQLETEWEAKDDVDFQLDFSDTDFPNWTITNGVDLTDPDLYELQQFDWRHRTSTDQNIVGAVNFKMPLNISNIASELKVGGKLRIKEKDRNDTRSRYKWKGADLTMKDYSFNQTEKTFMQDNYVYGPSPDAAKVDQLFNDNRGTADLEAEEQIWDSRGQTYTAKEDIFGGYAMLTMNINELMILAGARYENTKNDYLGTKLTYDASGDFVGSETVDDDRTTDFFMPMVHFKYQLQRMTNIRVAATRTMARPNYWDLVPYISVDPDREEIRSGNPELDVTSAWNLDLMAEHYFVGVGVVSGGFFYKDLDNIIFESTSKIEGGEFDNYEIEQSINGGKAQLYGFEINWQQQLNFLPGMLGGLGIYANYTKTFANSDLIEGRLQEEQNRTDVNYLPGQAGDVGNLAISYEWGGFSARLSLMYQDEYLEEVGGEADGSEDEWRASHLQMDFSGSYKIIPELDVFAEFVNITDEPKIEYLGVRERAMLQEYYSWWMRAGLRLSL
jgi:TonB-dependent receptor